MSYTEFHMKRFAASAVLIFLGAAMALAAENRYQSGTILQVEQKATTRVVYYVVDTPITKSDPYYDVSVQLKDTVYVARYTPRHKDDELPDEWKAGATVEARVQGRHLVLKHPDGGEVEFVILKKKPAPEQAPVNR
jgi:hypothetical protein